MTEPSVTEITMQKIREEWEAPLKTKIADLQTKLVSAEKRANGNLDAFRTARDSVERQAAIINELRSRLDALRRIVSDWRACPGSDFEYGIETAFNQLVETLERDVESQLRDGGGKGGSSPDNAGSVTPAGLSPSAVASLSTRGAPLEVTEGGVLKKSSDDILNHPKIRRQLGIDRDEEERGPDLAGRLAEVRSLALEWVRNEKHSDEACIALTALVSSWESTDSEGRVPTAGPQDDCGACYECLKDKTNELGIDIPSTRMILCPVCGNKRCPMATWHWNACTGSNEPGQPGSRYPALPDLKPGELTEKTRQWLRDSPDTVDEMVRDLSGLGNAGMDMTRSEGDIMADGAERLRRSNAQCDHNYKHHEHPDGYTYCSGCGGDRVQTRQRP